MDRRSKLELLDDPEFKRLSAARDRVCLVLTALTLAVYFGFIFLLAFNKEFFCRKVTANITVGIPIGIGVILLSWLLTGAYVLWANTRYDAMIHEIRGKVENGHRGHGPGQN